MSKTAPTTRPATAPTPTNESPLTTEEKQILAAALPASRLAEGVPEHVDVMDPIDAAMLKENPLEADSTRLLDRLAEVVA